MRRMRRNLSNLNRVHIERLKRKRGRKIVGLEKVGPDYRRQFLPTLSDLVDRLSIVQLKAIFIPDHAEEYMEERAAIEHDIDIILQHKQVTAADIHAILVIMLSNRFIWENESKARQGGHENDHLLRLTHSINGVRNAAKNKLARLDGGRKDYKIDALAADLPQEFGNWSRIFEVDVTTSSS